MKCPGCGYDYNNGDMTRDDVLDHYETRNGVVDNEMLARDLVAMLRVCVELERAAGWNVSMSFEPAVKQVISHLVSLHGDPDLRAAADDEGAGE